VRFWYNEWADENWPMAFNRWNRCVHRAVDGSCGGLIARPFMPFAFSLKPHTMRFKNKA
jgi:hypothetical protein